MQFSSSIAILLCMVATTGSIIVCPNLQSAANFAVIAASSVSNTGPTVIKGNLAISPSIALTGFNPFGVINGVTELGTGVALQAQKDVTSAYNYCKDAPTTKEMTGVDLAGKILGPGVYKFNSAAAISQPAGVLTLSGRGIYIFQIGSAFTTSANSKIVRKNGAKAGCIFWQVGSSATLGQYSQFFGNILADESVEFSTNVTYGGSVYAQNAAVTLITDSITIKKKCNVC